MPTEGRCSLTGPAAGAVGTLSIDETTRTSVESTYTDGINNSLPAWPRTETSSRLQLPERQTGLEHWVVAKCATLVDIAIVAAPPSLQRLDWPASSSKAW